MDGSKIWEEKEWEAHAHKLVALSVDKKNYIRIPDAHLGDYGIECYTTTGSAYQMYCPQEPLTVAVRYERHRDKITADIKKFIDNQTALAKLIYETKISRWILLVPKHDSAELVAHANKKAQQVKDANLPYVADDFRVLIHELSDYEKEHRELIKAGIHLIDIKEDDGLNHSVNNATYNENVDRKIKKISPIKDDAKLLAAKSAIIEKYVIGSNILDKLRIDYSEMYEQVSAIKNNRETVLPIEAIDLQKRKGIADEIEIMKSQIKKNKELNLSDETIEKICWEAITDWLMRCPLDF